MDESISFLMDKTRHSMGDEHFEDAVIKLQRRLRLGNEPGEWTDHFLGLFSTFRHRCQER